MDFERLQAIATEFEAPETEASQKSILFDELSKGVGQLISAKEEIEKKMGVMEKDLLETKKTNSHYANRLASQFVDSQEKQQIKKEEEKKTKTLSDVLGQY